MNTQFSHADQVIPPPVQGTSIGDVSVEASAAVSTGGVADKSLTMDIAHQGNSGGKVDERRQQSTAQEHAVLNGVRDILTQFTEELSQALAGQSKEHEPQTKHRRQQKLEQQQEQEDQEDQEDQGEHEEHEEHEEHDDGYAYTIGGHAVQQKQERRRRQQHHHQRAEPRRDGIAADSVPIHSSDRYIGGNRVNRWGELTGDNRMPKTHPQQRRQQQAHVQKHHETEDHLDAQARAQLSSPSTAHLRAVSPSPHLGKHARTRAKALSYGGGRGARELPREHGWPVSRLGEGANGSASSVRPENQGRGERRNTQRVHEPSMRSGRYQHAGQRSGSDDYETGGSDGGYSLDADAADTAEYGGQYSSREHMHHFHGDYLQAEDEAVAHDYRQEQPLHRQQPLSRQRSGTQGPNAQTSVSGRTRDKMHSRERCDADNEVRVPLP